MLPLLFLAGGSEAHPPEHSWEHLTFETEYKNHEEKKNVFVCSHLGTNEK